MGVDIDLAVQVQDAAGRWRAAHAIEWYAERNHDVFVFLRRVGTPGLPEDLPVEVEREGENEHVYALFDETEPRYYLGYFDHAHARLSDLWGVVDAERQLDAAYDERVDFEGHFWTEIVDRDDRYRLPEDHPTFQALLQKESRAEAALLARTGSSMPQLSFDVARPPFFFWWLRDLALLCDPERTRLVWGFDW